MASTRRSMGLLIVLFVPVHKLRNRALRRMILRWEYTKKDLTGMRFGRLVCVRPGPRDGHNRVTWEARCDCGVAKVLATSRFSSGVSSCGCGSRGDRVSGRDLVGSRFGRLVGVSRATSGRSASWNMRCDCGNEVVALQCNLVRGKATSCGCLFNDKWKQKARAVRPGARLWAKVRRGGDDDCWPWLGGIARGGYGVITVNRTVWSTHRLAWTVTSGEIPNEALVCHKCDNPPCCNPSHLFLGTHKDNSDDMHSKGRARPPHGVKHPRAKLTDVDVLELRAAAANGTLVFRDAIRRYRVCQSTIRRAIDRANWKHVA
jgi:hypothetical protein